MRTYIGRGPPADRPVKILRLDSVLAGASCRPCIGASFRDASWRVGPALQRWLQSSRDRLRWVRNTGLMRKSMTKSLLAVALVVVAWTFPVDHAFAQDRKLPLIGILWVGNATKAAPYLNRFLGRLCDLGWIDGKTAKFVVRYDGDEPSKFPVLAKELVSLKVDVLVTTDTSLQAAKQATATIPIVAVDMFDPIEEGVALSLSKPNGNITGMSWQSLDIAAKRIEFAKDILPGLKTVGVIYDANELGANLELKGFAEGARRTGATLRKFGLRGAGDFDSVFAAIRKDRPDALMISATSFLVFNFDKFARFALELRLPAISEIREFADAGGLLTYGVNVTEAYASAAEQVHRILKGAKPADVPFLQPTKFELIVNLKTAKALGIKIPESIMLRATEVIR